MHCSSKLIFFLLHSLSSLSLKYSIHFLFASLSPASPLSSFFLNFFFLSSSPVSHLPHPSARRPPSSLSSSVNFFFFSLARRPSSSPSSLISLARLPSTDWSPTQRWPLLTLGWAGLRWIFVLVVLIPFAPTEAHSFCARCGFFFFFFCCGLPVVVVVVVVVVPVVDSRGGWGWWCNIFLVVEYIILL